MRIRLALALFLAILPASAPAQERREGDPGRVEFFTPGSRRAGYAVIDPSSGRMDFYDSQSRRTGYGKIENGRIERFDLRSRRIGQGKAR